MNNCEAQILAEAALTAKKTEDDNLAMTTDAISKAYPLFASSLYNLIQNSENKITGKK